MIKKIGHEQFEEPALITLTKAGKLSSASGHTQYEPERKTEKPRIDAPNKVHRASNGVYTHNRRGMPLCQEFQTGICHSTAGTLAT